MLLYVLFLIVTTEAAFKGEVGFPYQNLSRNECYMENPVDFKYCIDRSGSAVNISELKILPEGTSCILEHELHVYPVSCENGLYKVTKPDGSSMGRKRQHRVKRFLNFIKRFICIFVCGHHHEAPNRPPAITKHASLTSGTPIYAGARRTTAKVSWEEPIIKDPEDGILKIVASPHQYKSGSDFSEGRYSIYFVGTDRGGLSVSDFITFEVKVSRCGFTRWPENGRVDCGGGDIIYGTTCAVKCKQGYELKSGQSTTLTCQNNGAWYPTAPPDCQPKTCANAPNITNGKVKCFNSKMEYGNICEVVCDNGFQVHGMQMIGCNTNGLWGSMPICKDTLPPRFLHGECPDDLQLYIDSPNNTAKVSWEEPTGEDNSNKVIIKEDHGYRPGQRFKAGSYRLKYTIEDSENNRGESCIFRIEVLTIGCEPPNLLVPHLNYECPESYRLGATCSLGCKSGYPMGGSDQIFCQIDEYSYPPKLSWKWKNGDLKPFCKETNCSRAILHEPLNGALACSEWTHGQMCQMQCESNYDIPNIGDGLFVCGRSDGKWRPSNNVPDCNGKIDVSHIHLPNEFYYYTGHCNSSENNIEQIKENFVQALNRSKFIEACIGVPDCRAKFVKVTCGSISQRLKRDVNINTLAYIVHFELILKYQSTSGKSADEVLVESKDRLYNMSDVIQQEAKAGHFNLNITGIRVHNSSYSREQPVLQCPPGTVPKESSVTCVGCPKGSFVTSYGACEKCPLGTFQNLSNAATCILCPDNSNTTETGAYNVKQCLSYCAEGKYSGNGLAPCTKCPSNSYQPNTRSTKCIRCEAGQIALRNGATSSTQCQAFDLRLRQKTVAVRKLLTKDALTIYTWIYMADTKDTNNNQTSISLYSTLRTNKSEITLQLFPRLCLRQDGYEVLSGIQVPTSTWLNVIWSLNKSSSEQRVAINGKFVYENNSFDVPGIQFIDEYDVLTFDGDMKISALKVLPRMATASEISSWASTCKPNIIGEVISMNDIVETGNTEVIIPSVCDDVNECLKLPCGANECINMLGNYKCLCKGGFTGSHCDIPPGFCEKNMCKNGATCVEGMANYTCQCPYGYTGVYCQIKAVDGMWSEWSNWTSCSMSCGGGISTRVRRCDSPPPDAEGRPCPGSCNETKPCENEKCPECLNLTRSYGLNIHCKELTDLRRCTLTCHEGLYFQAPPLPYYECGVATGYTWNHQNDLNPTAKLPSCTEIQIPETLGVNFDGRYQSISCTSDNIKTLQEELEKKLSNVECKKAGICVTDVTVPTCNSSGQYMNVTVGIHANTNYSNWAVNITKGNNIASHQNLVDFIRQTLYLEKSAQNLMNNSLEFFQVTIDGTRHTVQEKKQLSHESTMRCPPGSTPVEMFCADCPIGTYSDGKITTMCPIGQYQDLKGQTSCKNCPFGTTTSGIGSSALSDCKDVAGKPIGKPIGKTVIRYDSVIGAAVHVVNIVVGVSVSVAVLVLAVLAVFITRRYLKNRKQHPNLQVDGLKIPMSNFVDSSVFDSNVPTVASRRQSVGKMKDDDNRLQVSGRRLDVRNSK